MKKTEETCDMSYECASRCCDISETPPICNLFRKCTQQCNTNSDCRMGLESPDDMACCSFGHCTNSIVC